MRRILLPFVLLAVAVWLQVGCVFIPTFNKVDKGEHNVSKKVGPAGAFKPLRVGRATRDHVMRILGPPEYVTPDGRSAAYTWNVTNGIWVYPLCFAAMAQRGHRTLVLDFDEAGVLCGFRVDRINGNFVHGNPGASDDPAGMIRWDRRHWPDAPEETNAPTTRPNLLETGAS